MPADATTVYVNDAPQAIAPGASLLAVLDKLALATRPGVAVAVDAQVVPRTQWPEYRLAGGEQILIIQASQGG